MKYFFIVQGEGMGHTTQSIALRSMLERNGHSVIITFTGTNFFKRKNPLYIDIHHKTFFSPVFLPRKDKQGINLFRTFIYNFLLAPFYLYSIIQIAYRIRASGADSVIVFYDMVGQLGSFFSFSGKPVFSVSHHFFFNRPALKWPLKRKAERCLLIIHSWMASVGAKKKLALSFSEEPSIPDKNIYVVPPLIRSEILESKAQAGKHIHVYSLQAGFLQSVNELAKKFPEKEFRVFLNDIPKDFEHLANVNVFTVSKDKFKESLVTAGLVLCTAGFETLAEAIYLNKPLIVVPSKGHFEQYCNSLDVSRIGAAIVYEDFNFPHLPVSKNNSSFVPFVKWVDKSEQIFLKYLLNE